MIQHPDEKGFEFHIRILPLNSLNHRGCHLRTAGIELQQTIMASLEVLGDFLFLRNGFGDQFLQLRRIECRYLFLNFTFENRANLARAVEVFLKGIETFMIPSSEHLAATPLLVGYMDMNGRCLPDAI